MDTSPGFIIFDSLTAVDAAGCFSGTSGRRVNLGGFHALEVTNNQWRCDLHPRPGGDGKMVPFDSRHGGGRQTYLVDIGSDATPGGGSAE